MQAKPNARTASKQDAKQKCNGCKQKHLQPYTLKKTAQSGNQNKELAHHYKEHDFESKIRLRKDYC